MPAIIATYNIAGSVMVEKFGDKNIRYMLKNENINVL